MHFLAYDKYLLYTESIYSQPLAFSFSYFVLTQSKYCICLFLFLSFRLSPHPPAGWMVCTLARCSSWCPRRSLTWGEHWRRVKLTFYFITHIETPAAAAAFNVIQRVNAAQPGGNNKNINSSITTQEDDIYIPSTGSKAGVYLKNVYVF